MEIINKNFSQKFDEAKKQLKFDPINANKIVDRILKSVDLAKTTPKKAIKIADEIANEARKYIISHDFDKALEFIKLANEIYYNLNNKLKVNEISIVFAKIFISLGNYRKALKYLEPSLIYFNKINNEEKIGITLNQIGIIYFFLEQYEKAIEIHEECLEIRTQLGNQIYIVESLSNLTGTLIQTGKINKAVKYALQVLKIDRDNNEFKNIAYSLNNLGVLYNDLEQYDKAKSCLIEAISITKEHGSEGDLITKYNNIGITYSKTGDFIKGEHILKKSLSIATKIKSTHFQMVIHEIFSELYEAMGDGKKQIFHYKKYHDINVKQLKKNNSIETGKLQTKIEKYRVELDTERKERQIERLKNEMEEKNKELTSKAMQIAQKQKSLVETFEETLRLSKLSKENRHLLKGIRKELQNKMTDNSEWEEFEKSFNNVHIQFYENLQKKYPKLSPKEQKICALLKLKMNSKEITALTHLELHTIEQYRYRIRKKMKLTKKDNLLITIDLI